MLISAAQTDWTSKSNCKELSFQAHETTTTHFPQDVSRREMLGMVDAISCELLPLSELGLDILIGILQR